MAVFRRIYRMRLRSAVLVCLPAVLLCAWYAWDAFARLDVYRRALGSRRAVDAELWHIGLYDSLRRDLRRLTLPEPPDSQRLPRYRFRIGGDQLDRLLAGAERFEKRGYVKARLRRGRRELPVRLRLRGERHWHLLGTQKSLKVKFAKQPLADGRRVVNLINDPEPLLIGAPLVAELAAEAGLLAPRMDFARVWFNGADLGVYRRQDQANEGLLRRNQRFPCSLYSGDLPHGAPQRDLWRGPGDWKKAAWCSGQKADRTDLERLLRALGRDSLREFADFASHELDLERFATLEALEIAFGIPQRDLRQGHKLVFDPYRGRWEPVAWSLRGFVHRPEFELADHPLGLRLLYLPGYLAERNRILFRLLNGPASPAAVRQRGLRMLSRLLPDLASDPHWDATKLLPDVDDFLYRMLRPMDAERLGLAFEADLATLTERHRFLIDRLQANPLRIERPAPKAAELWPIDLVLEGQSGVELRALQIGFPAGCAADFRVLRDDRPLPGTLHAGRFDLARPLELLPVVRLVSRRGGSAESGGVRAVPGAVRYPLAIRSVCRPETVQAYGLNMSSGSRLVAAEAQPSPTAQRPPRMLGVDQVPGFRSGEMAAHPWAYPRPPEPQQVVLGPGEVLIAADRVFGSEQSVRVVAGTHLLLGGGVSLVFLGPVDFAGTAEAPIVIESAAAEPFGGLALQGPGTAGSSLRHLIVRGGRRPHWRAASYPGTIDIHDTSRVTLADCLLRANRQADDFLHAAYVRDLRIDGLQVEAAAADAIDLEFVEGRLQNVRVLGAGDEALDLMGSRVRLSDSVLDGAGGHALSAGERSRVHLAGCLLSRSAVGLKSKNGSQVELADSLLYRDRIGLQLGRPGRWYPQPSRVAAGVLYLVDCPTDWKVDERDRPGLAIELLRRQPPPAGSLTHLRRDVLTMADWLQLDRRLDELDRGAGR